MQIVSVLFVSLLLLGCSFLLFSMFQANSARIMRALRGELVPSRIVAGNGHPIRRSARARSAPLSVPQTQRAAA